MLCAGAKNFAPELEGLLLVAAEEKGLTGIIPLEYLLSAIVHEQNVFSAVAEKMTVKLVKDWQELQRMIL